MICNSRTMDDRKVSKHNNNVRTYHHHPHQNDSSIYEEAFRSVAVPKSNVETVPMDPIPGTDLYTGVFYKIRNKALTQSWLAWSVPPVDYESYCVADNSGSDKYNPGGMWEHDAHWMFVPSDVKGWYFLFNRGLSVEPSKYRPTVISEDSSYDGMKVGIYKQATQNNRLRVGGDWRWRAYWRPEASGETNYFWIKNMNYGPLTYTSEKHPTYGNYLQVVRDGSKFADAQLKYRFTSQDVRLEGKELCYRKVNILKYISVLIFVLIWMISSCHF